MLRLFESQLWRARITWIDQPAHKKVQRDALFGQNLWPSMQCVQTDLRREVFSLAVLQGLRWRVDKKGAANSGI